MYHWYLLLSVVSCGETLVKDVKYRIIHVINHSHYMTIKHFTHETVEITSYRIITNLSVAAKYCRAIQFGYLKNRILYSCIQINLLHF